MKRKNKKTVERIDVLFAPTLINGVAPQNRVMFDSLMKSAKNLSSSEAAERNSQSAIRLLNLAYRFVTNDKSPQVQLALKVLEQIPNAQLN